MQDSESSRWPRKETSVVAKCGWNCLLLWSWQRRMASERMAGAPPWNLEGARQVRVPSPSVSFWPNLRQACAQPWGCEGKWQTFPTVGFWPNLSWQKKIWQEELISTSSLSITWIKPHRSRLIWGWPLVSRSIFTPGMAFLPESNQRHFTKCFLCKSFLGDMPRLKFSQSLLRSGRPVPTALAG